MIVKAFHLRLRLFSFCHGETTHSSVLYIKKNFTWLHLFLPFSSFSIFLTLSQKPPTFHLFLSPLPAVIHIPPSLLSLSLCQFPCFLHAFVYLSRCFAFNSWGHPGPLGSYPRMLSRLMSCGVAFWTEQAVEPGLDRHSDSTMYSATAPPRKKEGSSRVLWLGWWFYIEL